MREAVRGGLRGRAVRGGGYTGRLHGEAARGEVADTEAPAAALKGTWTEAQRGLRRSRPPPVTPKTQPLTRGCLGLLQAGGESLRGRGGRGHRLSTKPL